MSSCKYCATIGENAICEQHIKELKKKIEQHELTESGWLQAEAGYNQRQYRAEKKIKELEVKCRKAVGESERYKMRYDLLFDAVQSIIDHHEFCECEICLTMVTFPKEK